MADEEMVVVRKDDLAMLLKRIDIVVKDAERAVKHIDNRNTMAGRTAIANIPRLFSETPYMRRMWGLAGMLETKEKRG
jgi:hypothetical protein